jgi:hypothetical protein
MTATSHTEPRVEVPTAEAFNAETCVRFRLTRGAIGNNGATPWSATVGLGTPPQLLRFMLDTGTVNTWITASACSSEACALHQSFDPSKSSSYRAGGQAPKSVSFGPWGSMGVVLGDDVCHLRRGREGEERMVALNEAMSLYLSVSYEGPQFAALDCDGGLAIPAEPCETPSALLEQLWKQKLIDHALASFYFDADRGIGSCVMGGVDIARFDPTTLNLLPMRPLEGALSYLWNVRLDLLQVAGATVTEAGSLVLDTGSSRFKGGCAVIGRMIDAITDEGRRPTTLSDPSALANYPDLELTLGGQLYTLTPRDYFLPVSSGEWELAVHYLEGLPDELLVVGSVFLDTVYSIFYYETLVPGQRAVGLATPVHKRMTVSGTWQNEFGSSLEIGPVAADGTFRGNYRSHTGASGVYPVMGVADPQPVGDNLAVSFSVSWRSLEGEEDASWHWVSGFTGLLQEKGGQEILSTTYLLQQNATASAPDWMATAVYQSTFRRKP